MDELAYQLNLSDTLDWSYDDDEDETNSTLGNDIECSTYKTYFLNFETRETINVTGKSAF